MLEVQIQMGGQTTFGYEQLKLWIRFLSYGQGCKTSTYAWCWYSWGDDSWGRQQGKNENAERCPGSLLHPRVHLQKQINFSWTIVKYKYNVRFSVFCCTENQNTHYCCFIIWLALWFCSRVEMILTLAWWFHFKTLVTPGIKMHLNVIGL